jgi:hypothetical protein
MSHGYGSRLWARTKVLHDRECSDRTCEPHTMSKWYEQAKAELADKDRAALDNIVTIMSGNEWDSDTTEAIYAEVVGTGREIKPLEGDDDG